MTSCTFPTPKVASGLWSVQKECDIIATPQCYQVSEMTENVDDQILDFEKLESDIMKNVLSEDNCESEQQKRVDIFFPSFNYAAPALYPPNSTKKSGKLFANSFLASELKSQDKISAVRSTQKPKTSNHLTVANSSGNGMRLNERRKLTQKKSFSKIFDAYSSREKLTVTSAKQNNKKIAKNQSNRVSPQQVTLIRQVKPPAAITIARRQPTQPPSFTNSTLRQKPILPVQHKLQTNPFEETPRKSSKTDGFDFERVKPLTLSCVLSPAENVGQKEAQISVGRVATQRRNLTLRQSTRCDQKKRKIGVKTFAQIVAAGPAVVPKTNNRFCKY